MEIEALAERIEELERKREGSEPSVADAEETEAYVLLCMHELPVLRAVCKGIQRVASSTWLPLPLDVGRSNASFRRCSLPQCIVKSVK
jgi:hypothetical protein